MRLLAIAFAFTSGLFAQAITVTAVQNRMSPNGGLCPGCIATVHYTPENVSFGSDQISARLNGMLAKIDPEDDGNGGVHAGFDILVPIDLPAGPVTLVVSTPGGSSMPFALNLEPYVPTLLGIDGGYSCSPAKTASPNDVVTVWAGGLGAVQGGFTMIKPVVTVGGVPADVLDATLGAYGMYLVRFRVPPGDGFNELTISMGGKIGNSSIPLSLPVGAGIDIVTAADYSPGPVAPETILVGTNCGGPVSTLQPPAYFQGDPLNLPTALGGTSIKVKDSADVERLAPLFVVSSSAVGYLVPAGTANGLATVTAVSSAGSVLSTGRLQVQTVSPRFFSLYQGGPARGLIVRLRDGIQTVEDLSTLSAIDMGPDTDVVYLVLWVSGVRGRTSLANVSVKIGGVDASVEYAGAQSETPGLDQLNVRLPRSLSGRGQVPVELTVDGKSAYPAHVVFK